MTQASGPGPSTTRAYGPAVDEPPLLVDPRRAGSLVGLAGGMVFIGSYSPALGPVVSAVAWATGIAGVVAALFAHYVRPVALGRLARLGPRALVVYLSCVVGQLALIAVGSRLLAAVDRDDLRPALIATVVGLHVLPFALAFRERMFIVLGSTMAATGAVGLLAGAFGVPRAAEAAAVAAGLVMIAVVVLYARGRFTPARPADPPADRVTSL